jgi:hypothetical protein
LGPLVIVYQKGGKKPAYGIRSLIRLHKPFYYRKDGATFKAVISTEEENAKEYDSFINVIF